MSKMRLNSIESLDGQSGATVEDLATINQRTIYVGSVAELVATNDPTSGAHYDVTGYHAGTTVGGGKFYWDALQDKSRHDGGVVIAPEAVFPADWADDTQKDSWFTAALTGTGAFVRDCEPTDIRVDWYGAYGDGVFDDVYSIVTALRHSAYDAKTIRLSKKVYCYGDHYEIPDGLSPRTDRVALLGEGEGYSWTGTSGLSILKYIGTENDNLAVYKCSKEAILTESASSSNYVVKNVVLDGNALAGFGLYANYAMSDSVFEAVLAKGCRVRGVHVTKQWYANYRDIMAYANYGDGMAFGLALGTEFGDINGISFINPRAHGNGKQLPNETLADWETRRFNEGSDRVGVNFGIGFDRNHGVTVVNPVSEHNYGTGIYKGSSGDTRGFVSIGGYMERNCNDAIADGGSSEFYEVIHDAGTGDTRNEEINGLWFNASMSGKAPYIWVKGSPSAANSSTLIELNRCSNMLIKADHEQFRSDWLLPNRGSTNAYTAKYQKQGTYDTAFTISDPRSGTANEYGQILYDDSITSSNEKPIKFFPKAASTAFSLSTAIDETMPGIDNRATLGRADLRWGAIYGRLFRPGNGSCFFTSDNGDPEGVVSASVGSIYTRLDGGVGTTLYVKEAGSGNTGWAAK